MSIHCYVPDFLRGGVAMAKGSKITIVCLKNIH